MSEEQLKSYYAIIPANVRYDPDLTPNAKLLYGEITALTNDKGYCWATNSYFANLYSVYPTTISKWLKLLKDKNYISIELIYKDGTKEIQNRHIRLNNNPIANLNNTYCSNEQEGISKNDNTPIVKNSKENITFINTTFNNTNNNNNNNKYKLVKKNTYIKPNKKTNYEDEFEELWKIYPRKKDKPRALKSYITARKQGTTFEEVKIGIENYNKEIKVKETDKQFIKHGSTWFFNRCWLDDYDFTPNKKTNNTKYIREEQPLRYENQGSSNSNYKPNPELQERLKRKYAPKESAMDRFNRILDEACEKIEKEEEEKKKGIEE